MTEQISELNPGVLRTLERVQELPSVPAVALEVGRIAREEGAGVDDLAEVISLDPAMSGKLLKLANSALLGRTHRIVTVKRACVQLGFHTTKFWVLSLAAITTLGRPDVDGFDYDALWKGSVVRAVSAKLFAAAAAPKLVDEAFISGLLSQVGQLAVASCLPSDYKAALDAGAGAWPASQVERDVLGYSSDDLGVALLHSWGLPAVVCQALLGVHAPERPPADASQAEQLARVLALAWRCERLSRETNKAQALAELHEAAGAWLQLDLPAVDGLLSGIDEHVVEMSGILQIKLSGPDMTSTLNEAQLEACH